MQQDLDEPDHARVADLDIGKLRGSHGNRQCQTLQERKLDVHVQALRLEVGEAFGG